MQEFNRGTFFRLGGATIGGLLLAQCTGRSDGGSANLLPHGGLQASANALSLRAKGDSTGVNFSDSNGRLLFRIEALADLDDFIIVSKHPDLGNTGFRFSTNAVKRGQAQDLGLGFTLSPRSNGYSFTGPKGQWGTVTEVSDKSSTFVCPTISWENGVRMPAFAKASTGSSRRASSVCSTWQNEWNWAFGEMLLADAALVACPIDPLAIAAVAFSTAHMEEIREERPAGC